MSAADFREPLRQQLTQYFAWLDDPGAPTKLRDFARQATPFVLDHLADERALTDVMAVLRRAVARGDLFPLSLVHELPRFTNDGGGAVPDFTLSLGNYALRIGAVEPLIDIASAALVHGPTTVPAAWICAILEAESGPDPRRHVVSLLHEWLDQDGVDPNPVDRVLRRRPALLATLYPSCEEPAGIVGVITRYVRLVHYGSRLRGCCPFHDDRMPSFVVDPKLQTFMCFGCKAGGGVDDFLRLCEGLDLEARTLEPAGDP